MTVGGGGTPAGVSATRGPAAGSGKPLPAAFYDRPVLAVARALIGCVVSHGECAGAIVETEAYHDSEPACHAFVGLTPRTETLFGSPGRAYVYRSYGIHALLNAVCEPAGVGAAVLIRALEPLAGIELMAERRGVPNGGRLRGRGRREMAGAGWLRDLCSGPGKLTQALGIELTDNGCDLAAGPVRISEPAAAGWRELPVVSGRRIGITKAAELPWRFCAAGSRYLSAPVR